MTDFYERLRARRNDDDDLAACIERVINQLLDDSTTADRPGMLLGKIQSGKTRGFLGVIARAFDRGYEVAIVLTKGTKTLAKQTVARIQGDFEEFVSDDDVAVFDIMQMPRKLSRSQLRRKIVIVAKKQVQNLERIIELFEERYPTLKDRRVLLVDDEADMASVRFVRKKGHDDYDQGRIAELMDDLRRTAKQISYLQVTATPYALYLQPEEYLPRGGTNYVFLPKRPSFTELLPIHNAYVGGDDYFGDFDESDPRFYLHVPVPEDEQDVLRQRDRRSARKDRLLTTDNLRCLRLALMGFILGACVRRWQQKEQGRRPLSKYAMIIHNDTQRQAHAWQEEIVEDLLEAFTTAADQKDAAFRAIFDESYNDISKSVHADHGRMPDRGMAFNMVLDAVEGGEVLTQTVNSDNDVIALLDHKAELKLETPFNIFIGGSILDRGITVPNLISFYYGRSPKRVQADTALQHSRMYGSRLRPDIAVTRFYTSQTVFDRLLTIHRFEVALRDAFEKGAHNRGVAFIQRDESQQVIPCSPSKISISDVIAVRPGGRMLPVGFQTHAPAKLKQPVALIDEIVNTVVGESDEPVQVSLTQAQRIVDLLSDTLDVQTTEWDWDAMRATLDYFVRISETSKDDGKVWLLARADRKLSRQRDQGRFQNAPDTKQQRDIAERVARTEPILMLFRQDGSKEAGWLGHPFWWPVLVTPFDAEPCVYAAKLASN